MPLKNFVVIVLSAMTCLLCYERATHNRYASALASTMRLIEDHFYQPVDRRDLFEHAMDGMVSQLDEYSAYISPRDYEQFQQSIEQEFVGIGIYVDGPPNAERITVVSPVYGTPAYRAGIRAGDVILKINDTSTEGLSLQDAIDRIKGPPGTSVKITVQHVGIEQPETMLVERERIRTRSVLGDTRTADGDWNYFLADHPDIGYVRINTFGEHTIEELREILPFRQHRIRGLIIDLRGNAGGLLSAAVDACDMFLDQGVIVSTRGRQQADGRVFRATSGTLVPQDLPVAILIDRFSASASEIVAACLKDNGRAVLVGTRTWGKGTVQNVIPLEGGRSALKLTTASYWRPNGENIHRGADDTEEDDWGVRPTAGLTVELEPEEYRNVIEARRQRDVLEGDVPSEANDVVDPQLQKAIEALQARMRDAKAA